MALYNTLFLFPFEVPRYPGVPGIEVSLDTLVRWYWRVRRWRLVVAFDTYSVTTEYAPYHGGIAVIDETGLLFPCQLVQTSHAAPGIAGDTSFNVSNSGGQPSFFRDGETGPLRFAGAAGSVVLANADTSQRQVDFALSVTPADGVMDIPLTIDGLTFTVPGQYTYTPPGGAADPGDPGPPVVTCTITPLEFWGWGGKYDTTTGSPL